MREFIGEWSAGPFHCYPFKLQSAGDCTVLHAHKHDHLTRSNRRSALYALLPNKEERIEALDGASDWRLVRANVMHLIVALEADVTCECLFSHYDENGCFLKNPKELKHHSYSESTLHIELPEIVKKLLATEGVFRG
jgi:hypothetical protein